MVSLRPLDAEGIIEVILQFLQGGDDGVGPWISFILPQFAQRIEGRLCIKLFTRGNLILFPQGSQMREPQDSCRIQLPSRVKNGEMVPTTPIHQWTTSVVQYQEQFS